MLLKNVFEISIWNRNLVKIFFTTEHCSCSSLSKEKVPNQVEIVYLSSNTLQTFRRDCVNTYSASVNGFYVSFTENFVVVLAGILVQIWQRTQGTLASS